MRGEGRSKKRTARREESVPKGSKAKESRPDGQVPSVGASAEKKLLERNLRNGLSSCQVFYLSGRVKKKS